jgi:lipopolysaccharide export system protein LptC
VTGNTPTGVFSANKLTADLESRTVSLEGNARLRIVPSRANRR